MQKRAKLEVLSWITGILSFLLAAALAYFDYNSNDKPLKKEDQQLSKGEFFFRINNIDSALHYFNQFIIQYPSDERGYYNLALAFEAKKDTINALSNLSSAIRIKPTYVNALLKRAHIFYNTKDFGLAISDINSAIEEMPNNANALILRGKIRKNYSVSEAEEDFKMALKLAPTNPIVYYNLGLIRARLLPLKQAFASLNSDKNNFEINMLIDSIIVNLNSAISYKENYTEAYVVRGKLRLENYLFHKYYVLKDKSETDSYKYAIEDFNMAIKLDSFCREAFFFRSLAKRYGSNSAKAMNDLVTAKKLGIIVDSSSASISNLKYSDGDSYLSSYWFVKN